MVCRNVQAVEPLFREIIKEHDREFNASGVPWKVRRPAEDITKVPDSEAVSVPPTPDITTKTALVAKSTVQELPGRSAFYELLVTEEGDLWVYGREDGIIDCTDPLFIFTGKFQVGQPATALMANGACQHQLMCV